MEGEQLFLIELLVDTVNIPKIRAIYDEILPARTCVSFQVKDYTLYLLIHLSIREYTAPITVIIIIDIELIPYQNLSRNINRSLRLYRQWIASLQKGQVLLISSSRQCPTEIIVQLSHNNVRLQRTTARSFAGRDANRSMNFFCFILFYFFQHC